LGATLQIGDGVSAQIGSLADGTSGGGTVQIGASDPTTLLTIAGNSSTTFSGAFSGPAAISARSAAISRCAIATTVGSRSAAARSPSMVSPRA
jgi:hypothetical protein